MERRYVILADGQLGPFDSKTAACVARYRPDQVAAVIDRVHAGQTTAETLRVPARAPVVATIEEALAYQPNCLVIGIAPVGGVLPEAWRGLLLAAIDAGLDLISGLHFFLGDDPEIRTRAERRGVRITDLRRPPAEQPVAAMRALGTRAHRVLTVGTDCNVGKMVTAFELTLGARRMGFSADLVATGQTGMLLWESGIPLDRVPGDFMAGLVEQEVLRRGDGDLVVVEGQGCLLHPGYSSVTLATLHGAVPDSLILVHHAVRTQIRNQPVRMPPLSEWVRLYEEILAPLHPGKVRGIAINPLGLSDEDGRAVILRAEEETGLPTVDIVSDGPERLLAALPLRTPLSD